MIRCLSYSTEREHLISNKNKLNVLLFNCVPVSFESFRRDLNVAKAGYISEY